MKNMNIKKLWTEESVLKLNCAVKRSGLKIWQIEKLSGTTQDTIYRTLHGQTVPRLKSLAGIAKAVKVDVGYLLDDNKWTIPDLLICMAKKEEYKYKYTIYEAVDCFDAIMSELENGFVRLSTGKEIKWNYGQPKA